jgi:hypothetical protein
MRPTLEQVAKNIETLIEKRFEGHDSEMNLKLVSAYLTENCFHVEDEDDFLESLLQKRNFYTLEERLCRHVKEFMGDGEYDRNDGYTLSDVA